MNEEATIQDIAEEQPEPKRKFRFKANQKSPTLELHVGEYRRKFLADEQPFEVADDVEAHALISSGFFVELKGVEKEEAESTNEATAAPEAAASPEARAVAEGTPVAPEETLVETVRRSRGRKPDTAVDAG